MEFQTRYPTPSGSQRPAAETRAAPAPARRDTSCPTQCASFANWSDLEAHLIRLYELEDVVVQLRPDYVSAEAVGSLDRMEVREIAAHEVLLSLSVGLRVSLDVHLFRAPALVGGEGARDWQPRDQYRTILLCAKDVFSRAVSFFLDQEGKVESASNTARAFCDTHFPASKRVGDYFPQSHWDYLQGAIRARERVETLSYRNESLVFCFHQESGIVDCLLQRMGASGYLLSLALDR